LLAIDANGRVQGIDPNLKPFKERRFHISLDHVLAPRIAAGLRYTNTGVLAAIEDMGIEVGNQVPFIEGNPGFGETRDPQSPFGQKFPNGKDFLIPHAIRRYDALEFRVQGSQGNLNFLGSYTLSRLWGNWSGLASSDESGRSEPGISTAFDSPYNYVD